MDLLDSTEGLVKTVDDDIRVIPASPTDDSPSRLYIGAQRQAYREGAECMEDFSRS